MSELIRAQMPQKLRQSQSCHGSHWYIGVEPRKYLVSKAFTQDSTVCTITHTRAPHSKTGNLVKAAGYQNISNMVNQA